jgi:hypothetical protein
MKYRKEDPDWRTGREISIRLRVLVPSGDAHCSGDNRSDDSGPSPRRFTTETEETEFFWSISRGRHHRAVEYGSVGTHIEGMICLSDGVDYLTSSVNFWHELVMKSCKSDSAWSALFRELLRSRLVSKQRARYAKECAISRSIREVWGCTQART